MCGKKPPNAKELDEVLIACDHEEIFKAAQDFKARVVMTDPNHPSGSDRIAEAVKDLKVDIVVNIQGDEPFIDPRTIDALAVLLKQDAKIHDGDGDQGDHRLMRIFKIPTWSNVSWMIRDMPCIFPGRRSRIIAVRTSLGAKNYKHLGLYAYRKDFLMEFKHWPKGILESIEELEQLRALEHGVKIKTTVTDL